MDLTVAEIADRLRGILGEWDFGREPVMGDSDEDIARREGRADVCDDVRDLLAMIERAA